MVRRHRSAIGPTGAAIDEQSTTRFANSSPIAPSPATLASGLDRLPAGSTVLPARRRAAARVAHAADHRDREPEQDLQFGAPGAEGRRPRDPQGRDLRTARPQRCRQDDADRDRLRHGAREHGIGHGGRARHRARLPGHARHDRARPAGADRRRLRDRLGHGLLHPRPVRQAAEPGADRADSCATCPCGRSAATRSSPSPAA